MSQSQSVDGGGFPHIMRISFCSTSADREEFTHKMMILLRIPAYVNIAHRGNFDHQVDLTL